jgi:Zn-dependent protease
VSRFPTLERELHERTNELNRETARETVDGLLEELRARYADLPHVIRHLDAIGTLTFLLFSLGWIRPVVIDPETFRRPRRDTVVLAMVALLLPIALALVLRMIRPLIFVTLPDSIAFGALAFVNTSIVLSLWFAAFNAIPILPLSADYLLLAAAPHLKKAIAQYELYIKLGLAALIVTGIVRQVISPLYRLLAGWIQGG